MSDSCSLSWLCTTKSSTQSTIPHFSSRSCWRMFPGPAPAQCHVVVLEFRSCFHKSSQSTSSFWVFYSAKSFFWPQKREIKRKKGNSSGSCVLSGHDRREQRCKVLLASRIWEENPSKHCLKPYLDFFFFQSSWVVLQGFTFSCPDGSFLQPPAQALWGLRKLLNPGKLHNPSLGLIDFCGWLKCWQDHSGLIQKCMNSVKSWAVQAFFYFLLISVLEKHKKVT